MDKAIRYGGGIAGKMEGRTFVRRVDPERHQLLRPPAWAHDDALLAQLERAGCVAVRLEDRGGGGAWYAPLAVIRERGFVVRRAGWPDQTGLALADWASISIRPATAADVETMLQGIGGAP